MYSDTVLPVPRTHETVAIVGTYTDLGPGVPASFAPTAGTAPQIIDNGTYYAAKDFHDEKNGRRIVWGWAQIPGGCQSLPREITWHAELQQLVFAPLPELASLRLAPPLAAVDALPVPAGSHVSLGAWPAGAGNQSEVVVRFPVPATNAATTTFGIGLLAPTGGAPTLEAYAAYEPPPAQTGAGAGAAGSWEVTVGIRGGKTPVYGKLAVLPTDKAIEIRVFTDHVLVEAFFAGGRVALTCPVESGAGTQDAQFTAFSTAETVATKVEAYRMDGIWVEPEDVAAAAATS